MSVRLVLVMAVIGFGGGLGALLRYVCGILFHHTFGFSEYVSIMVINVGGCFLIGVCFFLIEVFFNKEFESRLRPLPISRRVVSKGIWPQNNPTQPVVQDFRQDLISELLAGFVITGVLGGLTTFSLFSLLSVQLRLGEHPLALISNSVGTLILGVGATWVGLHLGRIWHQKSSSN